MGISTFDLSGRTALVTGGSRGIGLAIAEALAGHGARVAIAARDETRVRSAAESLSRPERPAIGLIADFEDAGATERMVAQAIEALGHVDILVNNAGISQGGKPTTEVDNATFDRVMAVNVRAPFILCREVGRHMVETGRGGRIINVTSIDGVRAYPGGTVYAASKAALELFTKSLAVEWAQHGILVNTIAPGWIRTDMTQRVIGQPYEQKVLDHTPMRRWGEPADLGGMAVFLASEAGAFTTGATMIIDGGYSQG